MQTVCHSMCFCDLNANTRWDLLLRSAVSIRDEKLHTKLVSQQYLKEVSVRTFTAVKGASVLFMLAKQKVSRGSSGNRISP